MKNTFKRTSTAAWVILSLFGTIADAQPRRAPSPWAKYSTISIPGDLASAQTASGVVLVDRDDIRFTQRGDDVQATIEREFALRVNDPGSLGDARVVRIVEHPGQRIASFRAARLRGTASDEIKPTKNSWDGCTLGEGRREIVVAFEDLEPGDIIAFECTLEIDGRNPAYFHAFDRALPVVQSDLTLEIPKGLMEGRAARGFHWWAGPLGLTVPEEVWEKPTSWRFRWGRAALAPAASPIEERIVATSWLFDATAVRSSGMAETDAKARYDDTNPTYHGPTLSATRLSGRFASDRHEGRRTETTSEPTEASFGNLDWALAGDQFMMPLVPLLAEGRQLARSFDVLPGASVRETVEAWVRAVHSRVSVSEIPLRASLAGVHRPSATLSAGCGSGLDRTVLLAALLQAQGLDARLAFFKREGLSPSLVSIEVFDAVGLVVTGDGGEDLYVMVSDGGVSTLASRGPWAAALVTAPPSSGEGSRIVMGDELTALVGVQ